jgi:hypothetical protein
MSTDTTHSTLDDSLQAAEESITEARKSLSMESFLLAERKMKIVKSELVSERIRGITEATARRIQVCASDVLGLFYGLRWSLNAQENESQGDPDEPYSGGSDYEGVARIRGESYLHILAIVAAIMNHKPIPSREDVLRERAEQGIGEIDYRREDVVFLEVLRDIQVMTGKIHSNNTLFNNIKFLKNYHDLHARLVGDFFNFCIPNAFPGLVFLEMKHHFVRAVNESVKYYTWFFEQLESQPDLEHSVKQIRQSMMLYQEVAKNLIDQTSASGVIHAAHAKYPTIPSDNSRKTLSSFMRQFYPDDEAAACE